MARERLRPRRPSTEVQAQGPVGEFGNMWYHVLPGTVHVYIGNGDLTSEADVTLMIYYSSLLTLEENLPKTVAV